MNRRLQQFLDAEDINQSQFADTLGVTRASVSHIIAGRNKPGFDFLESMSRHYPSLNLEWLISGKGRMYNSPSAAQEHPSKQVITSESIFSDIESDREDYPSVIDRTAESIVKGPKASTSEVTRKQTVTKRVITKVLIFYNDNTFEELK